MNIPAATMNKAIPAPTDAVFGLKFHQVAIYTDDVMREVMRWSAMGFEEWSFDQADLVGMDRGNFSHKSAHMAFNYNIIPMELEYVSYYGPRNSMDMRDGSVPFLSHMSTMVDELEPVMFSLEADYGLTPYHRFTTEGHTNPHCNGRKRFREAIYDTAGLVGFDIKLIQRVPWDWSE